jgi:urease accessory protein
MSVADSPSDLDERTAAALAPVRAQAGIAACFAASEGKVRIARLSEHGGYRLKFPQAADGGTEAVILNTGGGLVGGDRVTFDWRVATDAHVTLTTVAPERVYRTLGPAGEVDIAMVLEGGAQAYWLPQETILYSGARLKRRFEIDVDGGASLLLAETVIFGRSASGERLGTGLLHDVWRMRRDGRLVYADAIRLEGEIGKLLARPAVAAGGKAIGLVLYIAADAEARLEDAREALRHARSLAGASTWNGLLVVRMMAHAPEGLRADLIRVVERLTGARMPRVWSV